MRTRRVGFSFAFMTILAALLLAPLNAQAREASVISTWHEDQRGTPRLLLGPIDQPEPASQPEETVENYLRKSAPLFKIAPDLATVKLVQVQKSLLGIHFRYQQTLDGLPVLNAGIVVSVSHSDGRVYQVYNNTFPQASPLEKTAVLLNGENALDVAWNHLRVHGELLGLPTAEPVYVPQGCSFRLAYRTHVFTAAPFGYWEHLVDACTGKILRFRATEVDGANAGPVGEDLFSAWNGPVDSRPARTAEYLRTGVRPEKQASPATQRANGTGKAFDPDPKSTLLSDSLTNDSPASAFTGAYFDRALLDIAFDGAVYRLDGPWVSIQDFESPHTAPSTTPNGIWTALRDNNAFNDVMTYFHIDQNQRYVQSLGFNDIQHEPIPADSDGMSGADNSHFIPSTNRIAYGHGGVPDNEDADVILHEYWHAIQYSINPDWDGADTGAIGEGFGDYWPASYGFSKPNGPLFHPDWAFHWDGHNEYWEGRALDKTTAQYDSSKSYPAHSIVNGVNGDELWGTPIWQAFRTLFSDYARPREEMDKIIVQANYGLGADVTMPDMAHAIVAAAASLFPNGPHAAVFFQKFIDNNILQAPLVADAALLADEACLPPNGMADPGETVTYQFTIKNDGIGSTANLVGTLQASAQIRLPSGPQSYGAIPVGGSATRSFTFTVDSSLACGALITPTLVLQDGATTYPSAAWSITTGAEETLSGQHFDGVTAPALPAGWTTAAVRGTALWVTSTGKARSLPNSAFVADASVVTDTHLDTPSLAIPSADCRLMFYQSYDFEGTFDGGVLEIAIDGGAFTDLVTAGGSFAEGGYTGRISSAYGNPLGGRNAWVRTLSNFGKVVVVPPPLAVGKNVAFRFRLGCDTSGGASGWYVDDLRISRPSCCTASPIVPGDVNGDGLVNALDFSLLSQWLAQVSGASIREAAADLNHDGIIDVLDLVLLATQLPV